MNANTCNPMLDSREAYDYTPTEQDWREYLDWLDATADATTFDLSDPWEN